MIVSRQNPVIKNMRRLRRCKGDHALLEGPHLVTEACDFGLEPESVLATPQFLDGATARRLLPRLSVEPIQVTAALLQELSDADSPQGILALARLPRGGIQTLPARSKSPYLFIDGLQDPGNLGALARVAEAAGAAGMALAPGSVHPNHPRALRASSGSLLRLPVAVGVTPEELVDHLGSPAPPWVALAAHGGEPLYEAHLQPPLVLLLGAEGPGLSPDLQRQADREITIPLAGPVESLNAVVAAALVLFEIRRQPS